MCVNDLNARLSPMCNFNTLIALPQMACDSASRTTRPAIAVGVGWPGSRAASVSAEVSKLHNPGTRCLGTLRADVVSHLPASFLKLPHELSIRLKMQITHYANGKAVHAPVVRNGEHVTNWMYEPMECVGCGKEVGESERGRDIGRSDGDAPGQERAGGSTACVQAQEDKYGQLCPL